MLLDHRIATRFPNARILTHEKTLLLLWQDFPEDRCNAWTKLHPWPIP